MNRKPTEPDEMRMPADKFDEMMRRALGAPPPSEPPKAKPKGRPNETPHKEGRAPTRARRK